MASNVRAAEVAVQEYFSLVQAIAGRIKRRLPAHVEVDDLVQTGMVGLLESCNRYDASRSVAFSSYANSRITGAILDELRKFDTCSRQDRRSARAIEEARMQLRALTREEPETTAVAEAAGMTIAEYHRTLQRLESGRHMPLAWEEDEAADEVGNLPSSEESPFQVCSRRERWERLNCHIEGLKPRLREVLYLYYFEELGFREIGTRMGVGEARICQMHKEALQMLRRKAENENRDTGTRKGVALQ